MLHSIFKNSLYKGALNFFNLVLPLLVTPYLYRILSPETIGQVEYSTSIFGYFSLFGVLGIYNYGLREVSKNIDRQEKVKSIYANLFLIGCLSNFIVACIYLLFIRLSFYSSPMYLLLLITSLNFISNIFYTEWINEAFEDFKFIAIKTIIIRSLYAIGILLFVKEPDDVWIYLLLLVLSNFLNYIVGFIYARRYTDFSLFSLKWSRCNINFMLYLPPLLFILLLNNSSVFYTLLDRLMLGTYCGADSVAFYSVGQKIMEITRSLLLTLTFVTLPRLSYYLNNQYDLYLLNLNKLIHIVLMLAIPMGIGLMLLSHSIVLVFAGSQYSEAVWPLCIFGFRFITLMVENITAQQTMFLHGKEKIIALCNAMWGVCNLLLNYLFVKIGVFTPSTAIATTLFAELGLLTTELWYIKTRLNIRIVLFTKDSGIYFLLSLCFVPIIAGFKLCIMNGVVFFVLSILACVMFYILILYLLKNKVLIEVLNHFVPSMKMK